MDPILHQKYIYVHYHLRSLLRKWQQEKPYFTTKLNTTLDPATRQTIILRLSRFELEIDKAVLSLKRVIDNVQVFCATKERHNRKALLHGNNCGYSLKRKACNITNKQILLLAKFKEIQPISFNKLPYDFKKRLIALLPPGDAKHLKRSNETAFQYVQQRGMFTASPYLVNNRSDYKNVKGDTHFGYDIISKSRFLKLDSLHIQDGLNLSMNKKMFDHAVKIVSGNYFHVRLHGAFTWKHAIHLMNGSERVKYAVLGNGFQLNAYDYDNFFEAVVKWLEKKHTIMLDLDWSAYHILFPNQFVQYIKSRTSFEAVINFNFVSVFKQPPL